MKGERELAENIATINYQNKKIILIATAHVSRESAELVRQEAAQAINNLLVESNLINQ